MTDDIKFSLTGLDSLLGKLDAIKQETKRKTGRAALRKAANVVRDAAKANAERIDDAATGRSIAENVAVQWNGKRFKRTGDLAFRVGVRHGSKVEKKGNPDEGPQGLRRIGALKNSAQRKWRRNLSCGRRWKTTSTRPRIPSSVNTRRGLTAPSSVP